MIIPSSTFLKTFNYNYYMSKRILVIYATHIINDNLLFFLKHGYINDNNITFYIVFNGVHDTKSIDHYQKQNLIFRKRPQNIAYDFGCWSDVLFTKVNDHHLYTEYSHYIFVNSSCCGPFLPVYNNQRWCDLFINKITDTIKLVGPTINYYHGRPHVQSFMMCTDRIGLDIAINTIILSPLLDDIYKNVDLTNIKNKDDFVHRNEVGLSQHILKNNYNIACLLKAYENVDFRILKTPTVNHSFGTSIDDHSYEGKYFGISFHPYEVIFFKANRGISSNILHKYTQFHDAKN